MDENGNVQTDGSEKDQKTYEATATVEDSEDQICDFGTVKSDLEDVEAQYVQITNTGNENLNFQEISPEHFMVQDITEPLSAGESVSVWIQPREGLEPGEYDDMITYRTEEGIEVSFEAKIAVEGEDDSSGDEDLKLRMSLLQNRQRRRMTARLHRQVTMQMHLLRHSLLR